MSVGTTSPVKTLELLTWDLGRAYYAYVGMVERRIFPLLKPLLVGAPE